MKIKSPGSGKIRKSHPKYSDPCEIPNCRKRHTIRFRTTHAVHVKLAQCIQDTLDFHSTDEAITHMIRVYTEAAELGDAELYLKPPKRKVEVNIKDMRQATVTELVEFMDLQGIDRKGALKDDMIKTISSAPHIEVVGKIGEIGTKKRKTKQGRRGK